MKYVVDGLTACVRLDIGENVFACLETLAQKEGWMAGHISGLGAVNRLVLAYYDLERQEYFKKFFKDTVELLSLEGNFVQLEGKPFCHLHGVFSGHDFQCFGGHVFECYTAISVELNVRLFPKPMTREYDAATGLKLLNCNIPIAP